MDDRDGHRCRLLPLPVAGTYATRIDSVRGYGRHSHATFGIGWIEGGAQRSWSGRGTVEAFAGDVITVNPGEVHDGHPLAGAARCWAMVYIEPATFASIASTDDDPVELTRPVLRDPIANAAMRALFATIADQPDRVDAAATLAREEALVRAVAVLAARHARRPLREAIGDDVRGLRDRLAAELLDPPTLAELAAGLGASRFQTLRRFERAFGVAPHAWVIEQRVERARHLIRTGLTLADAAAASGFADQSHLHRHFTRRLGFTPGAWKTACGRG